MKSRRVTIFKTTLAVMDYPEFYRFLYNPDTQSLAIEPCEMDAPGAYALVGVKKEETYDVSSIDFVRIMYRANRWNQEISYRVAGIAYPDLKTAVFALRDALGNPAIAGVARLCGISPCRAPDTATALPNHAFPVFLCILPKNRPQISAVLTAQIALRVPL